MMLLNICAIVTILRCLVFEEKIEFYLCGINFLRSNFQDLVYKIAKKSFYYPIPYVLFWACW
jgi:hypothetical protein